MNGRELVEISAVMLGIAATIALEHKLVSESWRSYELQRRGLGIATVMAWTLLAVLTEAIDAATWIVMLVGFALAGGITIGMYTNERAGTKARARKELGNGRTAREPGTELPG